MADSELASALKDLGTRLQSASLKERKITFDNVIAVLGNPGINEVILRKLCKQTLNIVLHRYDDITSQSYVRNFLVALIKHHQESAVKYLAPILLDIATNLSNLVPSFKCHLVSTGPCFKFLLDYAGLRRTQAGPYGNLTWCPACPVVQKEFETKMLGGI